MQYLTEHPADEYKGAQMRATACIYIYIFFKSSGGWMGKNKAKAPTLPRIGYMSCFDLTLPLQQQLAGCCYRAREHVDPVWSRRIRRGGDSHPEMPSSPGSVGLAPAHPLTKIQAQKSRPWSLPARLGPVTVHRTRWGVGPRRASSLARRRQSLFFGGAG